MVRPVAVCGAFRGNCRPGPDLVPRMAGAAKQAAITPPARVSLHTPGGYSFTSTGSTMRYELFRNEIHVDASLSKAIENKVEKIKERLKRYHPDAADMEIRLEHQPKVNEFECNIKLSAFKDVLLAKKAAPELRVAVDKSFDAMMKELDHYRVKINKNLQ